MELKANITSAENFPDSLEQQTFNSHDKKETKMKTNTLFRHFQI